MCINTIQTKLAGAALRGRKKEKKFAEIRRNDHGADGNGVSTPLTDTWPQRGGRAADHDGAGGADDDGNDDDV